MIDSDNVSQTALSHLPLLFRRWLPVERLSGIGNRENLPCLR